MESVTTTRYAGIWFPLALSARTLPSLLGLTFRIPNLVIPGLANCRSRLGLLHLSSAYGMYWKLALIHGDLLSQTTAHTVVQSLRPPLLQQNMSIAFIFPHLLMVRSRLLLGTVHITIWQSFALYWLGFWYCTTVCCYLCSQYLIGTSLDFVVVYRGCCDFVEGRENRTVWFSLHQSLLKSSFLACDLFYLRVCVFILRTLYPSLCTRSCLVCCVFSVVLFVRTSLMLACPICTFLFRYSVVPLCVLVVLSHRLSLTVTKPPFALVFVCFVGSRIATDRRITTMMEATGWITSHD